MIIGGRESTQDNRGIGMKPFDEFCKSQCSLDMSHPMEIDPEGHGLIFSDEPLHIKLFILKHLHRDIDDPHLEPMTLQIF